MNNKTINRVRVKVSFPGYRKGDILELDPNAGLFNFISTTLEDGTKGDAFDVIASELAGEGRSPLNKQEVLAYMGAIFEDISTYKIRSFRELERRIDEIKALTEKLEEDASLFPEDDFNQKEALTVWHNMLWEYEWIMGMRELYFNNTSTDNGTKDEIARADQNQIPEGDSCTGVIDGNDLEEKNEKSDSVDQAGESY